MNKPSQFAEKMSDLGTPKWHWVGTEARIHTQIAWLANLLFVERQFVPCEEGDAFDSAGYRFSWKAAV